VPRIVFCGAGAPFAYPVLRALAERFTIVAVVRPARRRREAVRARVRRWAGHVARGLGLPVGDPVAVFARRFGIPCWDVGRNDPMLAERITDVRADLLCVAGYAWLLPRTVYMLPPRGAINLHASLLPRHRGPAPHFWTYHSDDREAGVTVHRVAEGADTGAILAQRARPLPRGFPVRELQRLLASDGADLLVDAVTAIAEHRERERPQDETRATAAPRVPVGTPVIDHAAWEVERVWHFLAGLHPHWPELRDERGGLVRYRRVVGYELVAHGEAPGLTRRVADGWELYSRGGIVRLG
jgi:methionyl-tRNA formyltransferase